MSLAHRYEDLGLVGIDPAALMAIPHDGLEELKLDSFEDGYKAGWDDSSKAHQKDQAQAIVAIAQRLEDISFTHTEAIAKLAVAMKPLMKKIVHSLLPDIAQKALAAHVLQQLQDLMKDHAETGIEIAVAPDIVEPLQQLVSAHTKAPLDFVAERSLSAGQVYLRANQSEREINLDAVRHGIDSALDAFFAQIEDHPQHG